MSSARQPQVGVNDLATTHPYLAREWHPTKNLPLTEKDVFAGTAKRIWWLCAKDPNHEWQAKGNNRVHGAGCPYCSGRIAQEGVNDLATLHPELAEEWHPTKNENLLPTQVLPNSHRKVWWQCVKDNNHIWQTAVGHRPRTGCPICANRQIREGVNDLLTVDPELAKDWHVVRNGDLKASAVTAGTHRIVWWSCQKHGHEWRASIVSRHKGNGCPYCSNKLVLTGYNDLATSHPGLAAEWDMAKNAELRPTLVTAGSMVRVWWKCSRHEDHSWIASIAPRTRRKVGCPVCANLQILVGFNDFATTNPGLAAEWHPTKNGSITPESVVAGTQKIVWWQCLNDASHAWQAGIKNRMSGTGCPDCTEFGYRTTQKGLFYFIHNPELRAFKVGITNPSAKSKRLSNFRDSGWAIIRTWENDGLVILNLETKILQWIRKERNLPIFLGRQEMGRHGGWSETFTSDGITPAELIEVVNTELEKILSVADNH